jgi:hypothetical protein
MNLKLFVAVAFLATSPAYAQIQGQGGQRPNVPVPTKADVDKIAAAIDADKSKLQVFCDLSKLDQQMAAAEKKHDTTTAQAIGAKENDLSRQLGSEYLVVMLGLSQMNPNSAAYRAITPHLDALDGKCK